MLSTETLGLDGAMLDEARNYLRIEKDAEDTSLDAILLAAIAQAEAITGQILIRRSVRETVAAASRWRRLSAAPVVSIGTVSGLPADGPAFPLNETHYTARIDANGDGYVSVYRPGSAGRAEVIYRAGLAQSWAELPESVRLGILRLAGHFHANRDDAGDPGPPAAVAALLRPWRRMRLSA